MTDRMAYAVMGETEDGVLRLRTYATREEAEDHPVKLSLWNRVWIEEVPDRALPQRQERTLRLPWSVDEPSGKSFTYLRDADGTRVASLFGSYEERQRIVAVLRERAIIDGA